MTNRTARTLGILVLLASGFAVTCLAATAPLQVTYYYLPG